MTGKTLDYHKTYPSLSWFAAEQLQLQLQTLWAVQEIRDHLEAQQETPASASQTTEQPAPSSSAAFQPQVASQYAWSTSSQWSSLANPDGSPTLSLLRDILDWLSSLPIAGSEPVHLQIVATETPIGSTPTNKATESRSGSASPSTEEPTREASGHAGEDRDTYFVPSPSAAAPSVTESSEEPWFTVVNGCKCGADAPVAKWKARPHRSVDGALALVCPSCDRPRCLIESRPRTAVPAPSPESAAQPGIAPSIEDWR